MKEQRWSARVAEAQTARCFHEVGIPSPTADPVGHKLANCVGTPGMRVPTSAV